jgi:23S rRNA (uracil1939-C5)-methyltransferase
MDSIEIILKVTDLSRGGAGVGRDSEGRVIFVPYTAPGDVCRVTIVEENKRYAQGELVEVIEPSTHRTTPRCPVFGQCGGCQWQHLPYELQWSTKLSGVGHALKRVQVELSRSIEEIPAERIWEYRNRIQLRGAGEELGFYKAGSKMLVPIERCDIARAEINAVLPQVKLEGRLKKAPFKVEIEVLPQGEVRRLWNARHSAGGFRQVHDDQNEKLKAWIKQALPSSPEVLLDLYGGSGNLSLPWVGQCREIHCVDVGVPRKRPDGLEEVFKFHRSPVRDWLLREVDRHQKEGIKWQDGVAILDPPREGLGSEFTDIAQSLEKLGVKWLVAVGCDADAWARDMSRWVKRGWRLDRVMAIDLFPQTAHIESVGVLVL